MDSQVRPIEAGSPPGPLSLLTGTDERPRPCGPGASYRVHPVPTRDGRRSRSDYLQVALRHAPTFGARPWRSPQGLPLSRPAWRRRRTRRGCRDGRGGAASTLRSTPVSRSPFDRDGDVDQSRSPFGSGVGRFVAPVLPHGGEPSMCRSCDAGDRVVRWCRPPVIDLAGVDELVADAGERDHAVEDGEKVRSFSSSSPVGRGPLAKAGGGPSLVCTGVPGWRRCRRWPCRRSRGGGDRGGGREAEDDLAHGCPLSMRRDLRREGGRAAALRAKR